MTTVKQHILNYLLDHTHQFVAGPFLADHFHVSRNAVWKAISQLEKEGYRIERHTKQGYRLEGVAQNIDVTQLKHRVASFWPTLNMDYQHTVTSTNDLGRNSATTNPNEDMLFIASKQTKGRGRRGRAFYSSLPQGLYFSLVISPKLSGNNDAITNYTIAAATAHAKALSPYLTTPIQIKWVNDLFNEGKKIAGILCEAIMDLETQQVSKLIIGVGTNLLGNFALESPENQSVAGTLFHHHLPKDFNYNVLLRDFLYYFKSYHEHLEDLAYLPFYRDHLMGIHQKVSFTANNQTRNGVIEGINDQGNLIIRNERGEEEVLFSGEVHFSSEQFSR